MFSQIVTNLEVCTVATSSCHLQGNIYGIARCRQSVLALPMNTCRHLCVPWIDLVSETKSWGKSQAAVSTMAVGLDNAFAQQPHAK